MLFTKIRHTIITTLLALMLIVTIPLSGLTGSGFALAKDTQQNRIIAHAMSHVGQKFKKIEDRDDGIKITTGYAWCAWFIEHCSYKSKLGTIIPSKSTADFAVGTLSTDLVNNKGAKITFVNKKLWKKIKGQYNKNLRSYDATYQPRKGDIIVFTDYQVSGSYRLSHVGFVYEDCEAALVDVKTIEGNTMASNENNWSKTSIVGLRDNADDSNKERRIAAYITPNYCQHSKVDKTTGVCKNDKCKADYCYFDDVDTACATDEESGITYSLIVDPLDEKSGWIRKYPNKAGNMAVQLTETAEINVIGTVKEGKWYKVSYINAKGKIKYGYVPKKRIIQNDNNISFNS